MCCPRSAATARQSGPNGSLHRLKSIRSRRFYGLILALGQHACPPREWAVRDRIPLRQVTLFSGEGAIGKSIVEMMLCVAHVLGKDWLGSLPEPGGAFYFGCEDDEPELQIRFHGIAAHYGTTFDELHANGLRFKSLAGDDAILSSPDRNGVIKPTALYDQLYEEAGDLNRSTSASIPAPTCSPATKSTEHKSGNSSASYAASPSSPTAPWCCCPSVLDRHQYRHRHQRLDCVAQ